MEPANVSPTVPGRLVKIKVCSCRPPSLTCRGRVSNSCAVTAELTSDVEGVSNGAAESTSTVCDTLPTSNVKSTVTTCATGTTILSVMCVLKPCFWASKRYVPGGTATL